MREALQAGARGKTTDHAGFFLPLEGGGRRATT
jgi:hypothetical protein